ncbi:MAG: hypothetical protein CMO01_24930 [Thalassobius sp.]|nr:hypothetical protein [Thalassovita sp.]|tara:strand:+ start:448 stop:687 length:240 start_codon:yes stop_codon:yes gene_type:complete
MAALTRTKNIRVYDFWMKCFAVLSFVIFAYYTLKDWMIGDTGILDKILLLFGVIFCATQLIFMILKENAKKKYFHRVRN